MEIRKVDSGFQDKLNVLYKASSLQVAIKIIDRFRADAETRRMIDREIEILKFVEHPHIIKLYEVIEFEGRIYLVTEYAGGGELYEHMLKHVRFSEKEARRYFRQIVSAVLYCHYNGIVHRDVKPENLLFDKNNKIKIIDFGFSTFCSGSPLSTFCGTPPYAAPELFQGKHYDGLKVDVWSLGVLLYVLVFGGFPFPANSFLHFKHAVLSGHVPFPSGISSACTDLIRQMLTADFHNRISLEQVIQHE
ncbi:unnamed protein product [Soboliphyme baturini]|uniref:Protein kinase domain-containing protein n=1 Tax=Soboliphyme baturini TaxID=241478 RepID=A0A183IJL4_9BILA|nr:unnamed protein product [Soboliphyme baturini]